MFSIVVPLFNKENHIVQTISSILDQTFENFEIIVVNDGSTDNSLAKVQNISDTRLKIITQKNEGVSSARNTGILNAKYDWIAFLDGDDFWKPQFLNEVHKAIEKYPSKKIFATGRKRLFVDREERYHNRFLPHDGQIGMVDYMEVIAVDLPPINSSNVVISKEVLVSKKMFNVGQRQHEDHDLWLRLCVAHDVIFINNVLSIYNKQLENTGSTGIYEFNDFMIYVNTLDTITKRLLGSRRKALNAYKQRFLIITYLKNKKHYAPKERSILLQHISPQLSIAYKFVLRSINVLPERILNALKKYVL